MAITIPTAQVYFSLTVALHVDFYKGILTLSFLYVPHYFHYGKKKRENDDPTL